MKIFYKDLCRVLDISSLSFSSTADAVATGVVNTVSSVSSEFLDLLA